MRQFFCFRNPLIFCEQVKILYTYPLKSLNRPESALLNGDAPFSGRMVVSMASAAQGRDFSPSLAEA